MRINNRKELQNIASNDSADIDFNDFVRIYGEFARNLYSFLTIDTTLPASDTLDFEEICSLLIKMAVADQTKTLDKKIMQNEAQYDLGRKAAKTSAFSSNNFNKYEYLTGEDLGLMPSTVNKLDLIILP